MRKMIFWAAIAAVAVAVFGFGYHSAQALTWEHVNTDGFATGSQRLILSPTTSWGDYLYVGTGGTTGDGHMAEIWRSTNGSDWTKVSEDGFGDPNNNWVAGMAIFRGDLYVTVTNSVTGIEVWRTRNGTSWEQVNTDGFGDSHNTFESLMMNVFQDQLYVGTGNLTTSAQIWRTANGTTWTQCDNTAMRAAGNYSLYASMVYDGTMYIGTARGSGAQIWKTVDGTTWTSVMTNGFGDNNNYFLLTLFRYQSYFYAATANTVTGVEVWRSSDMTTWSQVNTDGFGRAHNSFPSPWPTAVNGMVYVGTRNDLDAGVAGTVFRSTSGTAWEAELSGGAGDANNQAPYSLTFWQGRIYVGFSTFSGGTHYAQLWRSEVLPTLEIANDTLAPAYVGENYSQTLTTDNGTEPFTWEITAGTLPAGVELNSSTGALSGKPTGIGSDEVTVKVTDGGIPAQTAEKTFRIGPHSLVTGTGLGSKAHVRAFTPAGTEEAQPHSLFAYSPSYHSGVNVATGDVNGDGVDEIITAPRAGGAPWVRVFSKEGRAIGFGLKPFADNMRSGLDVAAADVNGDGKDEIIVAPESGQQAVVKVYKYDAAKTKIGQWNAFGTTLCGAHVAAGDVDGDKKAEIIVGAGSGNVPAVRVYKYDGTPKGATIMAFESTYRGGIDVAAGDTTGDGKAEIGMTKLSGRSTTRIIKYNRTFTALGQWESYPGSSIGARLAMGDIDQDGTAEVVTMAGTGGSPQVRGYEAKGTFISTTNFFAYSKTLHNGGDIAVGNF